MVRKGIADMSILQNEKITTDDLVEKYYKHESLVNYIVETLTKYRFLRTNIKKLAKKGKPFTTRNAKQIWEYQEKIKDNYVNNKTARPSLLPNAYHKAISKLKETDKQGEKYYPIENLCYLLLHDRIKTKLMEGNGIIRWEGYRYIKEVNPYKHERLREFSPTTLVRLLMLLVQLYRLQFVKEIKDFNDTKNKNTKNCKRRNKSLTTAEKKELVQKLKRSGKRQIDVINTVDFSPSTVKRLWPKVS